MGQLDGRRIAVSGASRGIGYHAAVALAAAGAHVIAIARTVGGLEELDDAIGEAGGLATLVPMDVTDFDAIDRLGAQIAERWGALDGFFGNAGVLGGLSPLGHVEPATFDKVMAVNATANWRFIRSFDPLLRKSSAGRVLLVTSGAAHMCLPFWGAYAVSKAAVEALGRTYAAECVNTSIKANLLNPGSVRTAMRAQAMPGEDPDTLPHPAELASSIVQLLSPECGESGLIYDFPTRRFLKPGLPG